MTKNFRLGLFTILCLGFRTLAHASPHSYYVSDANGSDDDANSGTKDQPFKTIQYAASKAGPGDTVNVMDGDYYNDDYSKPAPRPSHPIVTITKSGTSDAWITFQPAPGAHPKLIFNGYAAFLIAQDSDSHHKDDTLVQYVRIRGFTIQGNNRNINLSDAKKLTNESYYNGAGIRVDGDVDQDVLDCKNAVQPKVPNHIDIEDNTIYETPRGAIGTVGADYITIKNNTIYNCNWFNDWGSSAISTFHDFDSDTSL